MNRFRFHNEHYVYTLCTQINCKYSEVYAALRHNISAVRFKALIRSKLGRFVGLLRPSLVFCQFTSEILTGFQIQGPRFLAGLVLIQAQHDSLMFEELFFKIYTTREAG